MQGDYVGPPSNKLLPQSSFYRNEDHLVFLSIPASFLNKVFAFGTLW